jgi:hypothetical protein
MANNRTYLEVPEAQVDYAKRHGAYRDPANGKLYVYGDVPLELEDFLPKQSRVRKPEQSPACPYCGAGTERKYNPSDGLDFWGCSRFPGCKGAVRIEADGTKKVIEHLLEAFTIDHKPTYKRREDPKQRIINQAKDAMNLAAYKLGLDADQWLCTPHPALGNQRPLDCLVSSTGIMRVEALLRRRY